MTVDRVEQRARGPQPDERGDSSRRVLRFRLQAACDELETLTRGRYLMNAAVVGRVNRILTGTAFGIADQAAIVQTVVDAIRGADDRRAHLDSATRVLDLAVGLRLFVSLDISSALVH